MISSQNKELADKIGQLIIQVFNDAEMLTNSAFSWPSRIVASKISTGFDFNKELTLYKPSHFDLEYLTPVMHRQLLRTIVSADLPMFRKEMQSCLPVSFRCDASMDRTQKENEFLLLKIIYGDGREGTIFLGIGLVSEGGAKGQLLAIKEGIKDTVDFKFILSLINHISTDGEKKNVGRHAPRKLLNDEHDSLKIENLSLNLFVLYILLL